MSFIGLYHLPRFQPRRAIRAALFFIVVIFLLLTVFAYSLIEIYTYKEAPQTVKNVIVQYRMFPRGGDGLKLDQPWPIRDLKAYANLSLLDSSEKYIFGNFSYSSGLGNLMFQYAALRVYAETWNASLVLPADCLLRRAFSGFRRVVLMDMHDINDVIRHRGADSTYQVHEYQTCCRYEPFPAEPFVGGNNIVVLNGYFQSFRYFHPAHEPLIRSEFTFLEHVQAQAQQILRTAKEQRIAVMTESSKAIGSNLTFVGVHVRHGMDVTLHARNLRHGHSAAPADYFARALDDYRLRHGALVVIVVSDSVHWARAHITSTTAGEIHFPDSGFREVDLALLAACNHSIISTGTFSWWGGYLRANSSNARDVTRYGGWPTRNSALAQMLDPSDYFPPDWRVID